MYSKPKYYRQTKFNIFCGKAALFFTLTALIVGSAFPTFSLLILGMIHAVVDFDDSTRAMLVWYLRYPFIYGNLCILPGFLFVFLGMATHKGPLVDPW